MFKCALQFSIETEEEIKQFWVLSTVAPFLPKLITITIITSNKPQQCIKLYSIIIQRFYFKPLGFVWLFHTYTTFTLEQMFLDSWLIRNILVPDSFRRLHTKHESGIKTFQFCHESGNFWIQNLKWKHCIWIPCESEFPECDESRNIHESGNLCSSVNVVLETHSLVSSISCSSGIPNYFF